jgi:hypothetical protein
MKTKVPVLTEINITHLRVEAAVRYEEEDIPNDFPGRSGDLWRVTIEIDTGRIVDWPKGQNGDMCMKVCDCGTYTLLDQGKVVAELGNDYVPSGVGIGGGDYLEMEINKEGMIAGWPSRPDVSRFFDKE